MRTNNNRNEYFITKHENETVQAHTAKEVHTTCIFFYNSTAIKQVSLILHESKEKPKVPANDQTANPARKAAASMRTRRRRLI